MKVAVTGAAGFLGANLLRLLTDRGHEVTAIDRVAGASQSGVTWVNGNVLDPESMRHALDGAEVVYHLVALITLAHKNDLAWRVNTEGVRVVADAAREVGVRRMVHTSSIHAFNQYCCGGRINERSPRSIDPDLPVYDRSKWQGEIELRKIIDKGLDAVVCNPTGVYGPIDNTNSRINATLWDAARGRVPVMISGGFDLVDVRDVAQGLVAASERGRTGENYLLGGHFTDMFQATRLAAEVNGKMKPAFAIPAKVINACMPVMEPVAKALGSDRISRAAMGALLAAPIVEHTKATEELGYRPRPAEQTIRDLVAFYNGQPIESDTQKSA